MFQASSLTTVNFTTQFTHNIQHIHILTPTSRQSYDDAFIATYNTEHLQPFAYNIIATGWHTCLPRHSNGIHAGHAYNGQPIYPQHIDIIDYIDYQR